MLRKSHRLLKRAEFLRVAKSGKKYVMHTFVMQAAPLKDISEGAHFRVGFTVTKRCGNAVVRNAIKRRLRAAIFELSKEIEIPPLELVMIGRIGTHECDYQDLLRDMRYGLKKAIRHAEES